MRRSSLVVIAACLVAAAGLMRARAASPAQDGMSALDVLNRVAMTYYGCRTYRDTGTVTTVTTVDGRATSETRSFTTAFDGHRFRFEFRDAAGGGAPQYIVWGDGGVVSSWCDRTGCTESAPSLHRAIAGATGVTRGAAHAIPALLLTGEVGGRRLTAMTEAQRLSDEPLDGAACYRIEGAYAGRPCVAWIDKRSFLVRRLEVRFALANGSVSQTLTYAPAIGEDVPDEMLALNAPE